MGWAGSLAAAYRLNPRKLAARGLDPCPNWTSESVLDHFVLERGVVRLSPSPYTGWRRESGRGHRHGLVPSWKAVQQTRATGTRGLAANSTGGKCRRRKDLALPHLPNWKAICRDRGSNIPLNYYPIRHQIYVSGSCGGRQSS